jgi:DNA-binding MarR family transcriptional regulator
MKFRQPPEKAPDGEDAREILDAIRRIVKALRVTSRESEKRFGLSAAQLFVLHKLAGERGISLSELAARTLTHQSSVSVVVKRLIDQGLVQSQRSESDARKLELSLTPRGRALLRKVPGAAQDRLISGIRRMPASSRRTLARLLTRLVTETGLSEESPSLFFEDDHGSARRARGEARDS